MSRHEITAEPYGDTTDPGAGFIDVTCSCGTYLAEHRAVLTLVELNELAHAHIEAAERAAT